MRMTDRYLENTLHRFPEIYDHINQQRAKLKELHEENLKLLEFKRLYNQEREEIAAAIEQQYLERKQYDQAKE